ncbi:class I SAM-dependent methyltransferase [Shigella flexneri]
MSQNLAASSSILLAERWRTDGNSAGGRGEAVAKAVGIKGDYLPDVVDATAGLGRDAFVLASVGAAACGCWSVIQLVAALLTTAWRVVMRMRNRWLVAGSGLQLIHASSLTALTGITRARRWFISTRCSRISRKAR